MNAPRLTEVFLFKEEVYYHGSPFGGLDSFDNVKPPVFFTKDRDVAVQYAVGSVLGAQKDPGGIKEKKPTVYRADVKPGNVLDFRKDSVRKEYSEFREKELSSPDFDQEIRWMYPPVDAEGFLMSYTGLPNFGKVRPLFKLFKKYGKSYDSVLIDEGSQGISLAIMDPKSHVKILDRETP